jgi:hypothetical protein
MHALYDRLSAFAVFREGSTLRADYQNHEREWSNVEVHLAGPSKSDGHVLWYQVFFKDGRPASFLATKDVAARLCGLPGGYVEIDL